MTQHWEEQPIPQKSVQPWEGPGHAGETGREELAEVQQRQAQSPAPGEE